MPRKKSTEPAVSPAEATAAPEPVQPAARTNTRRKSTASVSRQAQGGETAPPPKTTRRAPASKPSLRTARAEVAASAVPEVTKAQHSYVRGTGNGHGDSIDAWADSSLDHEEIARIAYSYWEQRGYRGGTPEEDWFRAIEELRRRREFATFATVAG